MRCQNASMGRKSNRVHAFICQRRMPMAAAPLHGNQAARGINRILQIPYQLKERRHCRSAITPTVT